MEESGNRELPEYINEQANHSWQIELLISLGMIFTLAKFPPLIADSLYLASINTDINSLHVTFYLGLNLICRILMIGFGFNLLMRAIWLALLGVFYSYPQGVDHEKLDYSEQFNSLYKPKETTLEKINRLEKYSSLSFSLGVIISFSAIGTVVLMLVFFFLFQGVIYVKAFDSAVAGLGIMTLLIVISLGLIDRVVFDIFKKRSKLNSRYFPISQFIRKLNLTYFFRYEWLTIISNSGRLKVSILAFLYVIISVVITLNDLNLNQSVGFNRYTGIDSREFKSLPNSLLGLQNDEYDDILGEKDIIRIASIPSEFIEGNLLPLFVTYDKGYDQSFETLSKQLNIHLNRDNISKVEEYETNTKQIRKMYNESIFVELNNEELDSLKWYNRTHPITKQLGFYTLVDLAHLPKGQHSIIIRPIIHQQERIDTISGRWIPFWKTE